MAESQYEDQFLALYEGEIDFASFARSTSKLWRRIAAQIRRRWAHPAWHGFEDTVNDLLLAAWEVTPKYDPAKGASVQRFVVWHAYDKAKKACHKVRGASHSRPKGQSDNPDRAKSRIPRVFSSLGEQGSDDGEVAGLEERLCFAAGVFSPPNQEADLLDDEIRDSVGIRVWAFAESFRELEVLSVFAEARSIDEASERLYDREDLRKELALESVSHARDLVAKLVRAVSVRIATAA
jgi:hypothetical protein